MPRKATGSAVWRPHLGCWVAVVTSLDKSRKWIPMRKLTDQSDNGGARAQASIVSKQWRERGCVDDGAAETLNEYFTRWCAERRKRGLASVRDDEGRYRKWIEPQIGTLELSRVTSEDLERLVSKLDTDVRAARLGWKTAVHTWAILTKLFDDACRSKDLALRARKDNPARDVRGPDRGDERAGAYLFPSEVAKLLSCERVPVNRRLLYAIAIYTGMRKGEIRSFHFERDVHTDEGFIHVHTSRDRDSGVIKATKQKLARKVPIEPALVPLLDSLTALPTRTVDSGALPIFLREDLKASGVTRTELFTDTATTRKLDFHDLRHTYGTWRAIRGDDLMKISRAMGHSNAKTTQRYINEAQVFDLARFGTPFGPLPEALMKRSGNRCKLPFRPSKYRENEWVERDSKPVDLSAEKRRRDG